jgi:hypothetical protein
LKNVTFASLLLPLLAMLAGTASGETDGNARSAGLSGDEGDAGQESGTSYQGTYDGFTHTPAMPIALTTARTSGRDLLRRLRPIAIILALACSPASPGDVEQGEALLK